MKMKNKIDQNVESVQNQPFSPLTSPLPIKEYVLYTLLNVDNYVRPLRFLTSATVWAYI